MGFRIGRYRRCLSYGQVVPFLTLWPVFGCSSFVATWCSGVSAGVSGSLSPVIDRVCARWERCCGSGVKKLRKTVDKTPSGPLLKGRTPRPCRAELSEKLSCMRLFSRVRDLGRLSAVTVDTISDLMIYYTGSRWCMESRDVSSPFVAVSVGVGR